MKPGDEPVIQMMWHDGAWWQQAPSESSGYTQLGVAPIPKNRWEGFWHHLFHGLLMGYPLFEIIIFSWCNRASFVKPPAIIEVIGSASE